MGEDSFEGLSHVGISCFDDEFVRQGLFNNFTATILDAAFLEEADLRGIHRVSEHGEVEYHQYVTEEKSLHRRTHPRGDESVAIHHTHEADLPDRLPWSRAPQPG